MRYLRSIVASSFLLALVGLFTVGCRELPSDPIVTLQPVAGEQALLGGVADALRGLLVKTLDLVGNVGGSLTNGRWKVTIPAGAIDGTATVAIGVPNATSDQCSLEILPLSKNRFKTPVTLTIDCRNVPLSQLKTYVVFWFNPSTGKWEEVPGSKVDIGKKTVSAPLWHFSRYAAGPRGGKAGW